MPELVQLFQENPILQRTEQFNDVLGSLPSSCCDLVPIVYDELVGKVGIRPDYLSVAKKLRALSRMKRNAEAKALWQGWLVSVFQILSSHITSLLQVLNLCSSQCQMTCCMCQTSNRLPRTFLSVCL